MFVDASAIIAIIIGEPERLAFEARLEQADRIYTSPLAIYEAVMGVARIRRLSISDAHTLWTKTARSSTANGARRIGKLERTEQVGQTWFVFIPPT